MLTGFYLVHLAILHLLIILTVQFQLTTGKNLLLNLLHLAKRTLMKDTKLAMILTGPLQIKTRWKDE